MKIDLNPFIEQRTKALAVVALTRRRDLVINWLEDDSSGMDMYVRIGPPSKQQFVRSFGVLLKGTAHPIPTVKVATSEINKRIPPDRRKWHSFPVLIMLFSMEQDKGYWAWYTEPSIEGDNPKLSFPEKFTCNVINEKHIEEIVQIVDAWYDALYRILGNPQLH